MAIKKKTSRDTYRSNVKIRPLRQNGLEAQYQGLDISEVNIDHAGLAIIGRGGFQTRRDVRKVRKQYIVDVPRSEHFPTAELIFKQTDSNQNPFRRTGTTWDINSSGTVIGKNLSELHGKRFKLSDQIDTDLNGIPDNVIIFQFRTDTTYENGEVITASPKEVAINIAGNKYSIRNLFTAITSAINANFPENTFSFHSYPKGSTQTFGSGLGETHVEVLEDKLHITLNTVVNHPTTVLASLENPDAYAFFDVTTNVFGNQQEQHEWRLYGYHKDNSNPRMFYEDIRVDALQSVVPHSRRTLIGGSAVSLFRQDQFAPSSDELNYDANIGTKGIAGIAGDPTGKSRFDTHDSTEILIRQYPKREEIMGTYKDNFQWHEDPHYVLPDQQTWSLMSMYAEMYSSTLEEHISKMFSRNYVTDLYYEDHLLSGRVDVFDRLSRVFDSHNMLTFERHQNAVFTQYLDPLDDFVNLQQNRFPKEDCANRDVAFEDIRGTRRPLGVDGAIKGVYTLSFSAEPANNDRVKLSIGNGFLHDFTIELKFKTSGGHRDPALVDFNPDECDLEIDVSLTTISSMVSHIVTKLTALKTTAIGACSFAQYDIVADGTNIKFSALEPGIGFDIIVLEEVDTSSRISFNTSTLAADSYWARENSVLFMDYFDQEPLDSHDYIEEERYTRIDDVMLEVVTKNRQPEGSSDPYGGRSYLIDRREWQQSAYVYTSTGFISSQTSGQDGIMYRELKR